jgi:hypothetical protein
MHTSIGDLKLSKSAKNIRKIFDVSEVVHLTLEVHSKGRYIYEKKAEQVIVRYEKHYARWTTWNQDDEICDSGCTEEAMELVMKELT